MPLYIPFNEFIFFLPMFCPQCFSIDIDESIGSVIQSQPILSITLCKNILEIFLEHHLQAYSSVLWSLGFRLSALLMLHKNKLQWQILVKEGPSVIELLLLAALCSLIGMYPLSLGYFSKIDWIAALLKRNQYLVFTDCCSIWVQYLDVCYRCYILLRF